MIYILWSGTWNSLGLYEKAGVLHCWRNRGRSPRMDTPFFEFLSSLGRVSRREEEIINYENYRSYLGESDWFQAKKNHENKGMEPSQCTTH